MYDEQGKLHVSVKANKPLVYRQCLQNKKLNRSYTETIPKNL